jgi:hypothetical protein
MPATSALTSALLALACVGCCVAVVHVDAVRGADGGGCGAAAAPCGTIAAGVAAANALDGATINIAAGSYSQSSCGAVISASMTVRGAGAGATVVDCGQTSRGFEVCRGTVQGACLVALCGLTLRRARVARAV